GGEIYFYFSGSVGRKTLAAVGQYTPSSARIRILADGDALAAATGMGRSLPLARGSLVSDGRFIWIWIRHTDAWSVFKIDPVKLAPDGPAPLAKAFEKVTLEDKPLELTRDEYNLAPAPDGNLFLLDGVVGQLLKIDANGKANVVRSLAGLPRDLSTPVLDRGGKMLMF